MSFKTNDSFFLDLTKYFLLFLSIFFVIDYSPKLLSEIQPDSLSYIEFDNIRTSSYTLIINFCKLIGLDLILFQVFLISLSILIVFISIIEMKINIYLSIIFIILMLSNIYYTSYTHTYLTESVFFSFINIITALCFFLKKKKKTIYFIFGLSLGIVFSIKTIGFLISLPFLLFSFFLLKKNNHIKMFIIIIVGLLIPIVSESIFFHSKHEKRSTVFPSAVFGKVFFLSGKDSFKIDNYPKKFHEILSISKDTFNEPVKFLKNIKNPILKSDLTADYEVIAQYQFLGTEKLKEYMHEQDLIRNSYYELFFSLLKNNFIDYCELSLSHYIGMWSTGAKFIFLDDYIKTKNIEIPMSYELKKSSGPMNLPDTKILLIAQVFFFFLFIGLTLSTIYYIYLFIRMKEFNNFFGFIIINVQLYLFIISFVNVATIRYLMPVYPLILISIIYLVQFFYYNFRNRFKNNP